MSEPILNIKVRKEGSPVEVFIASFVNSFSQENMEKDLKRIKNTVLTHLQKFIQAHRKRTMEVHDEPWRFKKKNNLFNVIKEGTTLEANKTGNIQLGIGRINPGRNTKVCLKKNAKYWFKINYGGKIEMGDKKLFGYFGQGNAPMFGGGKEVFKSKFKNGDYQTWRMIPKKLIPPMYYLNEMAKVADIEIALLHLKNKKRMKSKTKVT